MLYIFMFIGTKILGFKYIDLKKTDDSEDADIEAITFSHNEEYVNKISDIE